MTNPTLWNQIKALFVSILDQIHLGYLWGFNTAFAPSPDVRTGSASGERPNWAGSTVSAPAARNSASTDATALYFNFIR